MCTRLCKLSQRNTCRHNAAFRREADRKRGELGEAQTHIAWVIPSQADLKMVGRCRDYPQGVVPKYFGPKRPASHVDDDIVHPY